VTDATTCPVPGCGEHVGGSLKIHMLLAHEEPARERGDNVVQLDEVRNAPRAFLSGRRKR
jgi:hypothetical protein